MKAQLEQQLLLQRWIGRSFENFKKMERDNFTATKVRSRIATLQEHWAQFQAGDLLMHKGTTEEARLAMEYFTKCQFDATKESYQNVRDALNEILEDLEPVVSPFSALHSTSIQQEMPNLGLPKMPPIKLPLFDGQYSEWENFRDRFSALVIENQTLSDFARMHYLSSSLKGSALDCIASIPVTAHNFNVVWSAIKRRFENKRRLISTHLSALLGWKPLQKESATDLQALCDRVQVAVSALNNLG
ncbi:uncharacterized protein [Cardiocondyla obscurior]|uniref:uncharacterized protein n=1 Tax=Cardiocondyla obscurior TaxID=286306 RepID=UPI0039656975